MKFKTLPLYGREGIRQIEARAFARRPSFELMQQAGAAAARAAQKLMPRANAAVVLLAGVGNNGGDAYIAAAALRRAGANAQVAQAAPPQTEDGKRALALWQKAGGKTVAAAACAPLLQNAAVVVDGLFGIGLRRPLTGAAKQLAAASNAAAAGGAAVLALDLPSGICANSGARLGDVAVFASQTITFLANKPGLHTGAGRAHAGRVVVEPLGETPARLAVAQPVGELLLPPFAPVLRGANKAGAHKGNFGLCLLVGGAAGMLGALVLAARAAARLGAGKTRALCLAPPPPLDWLQPDIMWGRAGVAKAADFAAAAAIAAGMGMGQGAAAKKLLPRLLGAPAPLLLDADALNLLAASGAAQALLRKRKGQTILTPHPGEAARLLACKTQQVEDNRMSAAAALAKKFNAVVVLKGGGTVVADDGGVAICAAGNVGLARGGSGDVLSGIIAALLAQGVAAGKAARAGVLLHAQAADILAARHGKTALCVDDLATTAAALIKD